MKLLTTFLLTLFTFSMAQASLCTLEAEMDGSSGHLIVGGTHLNGQGVIKCADKKGVFRRIKYVNVEMEGAGFGIGFTKIKGAKLFSTGLGVVESYRALTGNFLFIKNGFQVGPVGADAGLTLYFSSKTGKSGIAIPFGLTFKKGVGLEVALDLLEVRVTPMSDDDL